MLQNIVPGLITFLHEVFTVMWIGGLFVLVLVLLPVLKKESDPQKTKLYASFARKIQLRLRIYVYVAIVGLWATGMFLSKLNQSAGLINFSTTYQTLLTIKHLLIFAMIAMAVWRTLLMREKPGMGGKDGKRPSPEQLMANMKKTLLPLFINFGLGLAVMFLSGILPFV
ncbi:MAG: hypothetical protein ACTSYI_07940 [Promethearchaeota archaeon]